MKTNGKPAKPPVAAASVKTPAGVIRKGQRRPFRKATQAEVEDRVHALANYMGVRPLATQGQLKAYACRRWNLAWQMALIYVTRARKFIRQRSSMSRQQAMDIVVPVLVDVVQTGSTRDKLHAAAGLREVFGLDAPRRTELSGPAGGPIETRDSRPLRDLPDDRLRAIVELAGRQGNGNGGDA